MANSYRAMHKFWLDFGKPEEREIDVYIRQELKKSHKKGGGHYTFAASIRDGLRLIRDLRQGKVTVLLELFPWIADHFHPKEDPDSSVKQQLKRLENLLLSEGNVPVKQLGSGRKSGTKPVELSEDLIEIISPDKVKKDLDNVPQFNMVIQMSIMTHGHCNGVSPEARAYGVRTGRIKIEHLTPAKWQAAQDFNKHQKDETATQSSEKSEEQPLKIDPNPPPTGGPKAMNVPQFAPPEDDDDDFDDLLDLL